MHYGADPTVKDAHGQSLLMWIIDSHIHHELLYDYIQLLLKYKCVFNCADVTTGNTIIHHIILHYNDNITPYTPILISICKHIGVDCIFDWKNHDDETAFQVCMQLMYSVYTD